jgi:hypothetical protein
MVPGLEQAGIIRPGYAIEYDFIDPRQLTPYLETAKISGLLLPGNQRHNRLRRSRLSGINCRNQCFFIRSEARTFQS